MKRMFLDIETLPAPAELEELVRQQYEKTPDRAQSFGEYFRRTSLNANFGQILCIGYAQDEQPANVLEGDEPEQLRRFWEIAREIDQFIGHNILEFDLPFIMKRSIIHRVHPSRGLSFARYRTEPVYDTKKEWDSWANVPATSLDTLAKLFGYETSKKGIDGSQVYDFWLAGKRAEIEDYCKRDVELARQIFHRLTFTEGQS